MAIQRMYSAVNNSIQTSLAAMISATDTEIVVTASAPLPSAPNVLTIGTDDNAELVYFTGRIGFRLTGCVRGYNGTAAQIWPEGSPIYRAYTAVDHQLFVSNINDLSRNKLDNTGNAATVTVVHTASATPAALESGETLGVAMGKIARWFTGLGAAAWASFGTGAANAATGNHTHDARYVRLDADGMAEAGRIMTRGVKVTASRTLGIADAGRCLDVTSSGAVTVTLPTDAAASLPVDTEIEIAREGSGKVTVSAPSGVVLRSVRGTRASFEIANQYGMVALKKKGANDWRVMGDIV